MVGAGGFAAAAADAGPVEADALPLEEDEGAGSDGLAAPEAPPDFLLDIEVVGLGGSEATILQLAQAALISFVCSFGLFAMSRSVKTGVPNSEVLIWSHDALLPGLQEFFRHSRPRLLLIAGPDWFAESSGISTSGQADAAGMGKQTQKALGHEWGE